MRIFNTIGLLFALSLAAQGADAEVDRLLALAARAAERFVAGFPAVACTEKVTQVKFNEARKAVASGTGLYDYLILLDTEGGGFTVEESRLSRQNQSKEPAQPLLATTGFAVMIVIFHPHFQPSYRFTRLEPEVIAGTAWERLQFEHLSGEPSPSVLEVRGRQYPLTWRGTAWIHPETGMVGRIRTELSQPLEDIGLVSLRSDVEYGATRGLVFWAPRTAVIEADTLHQHWRNSHEFSDYRRFEVSSQQNVQAPGAALGGSGSAKPDSKGAKQ
ncbi:MAG: hypothetical protein HY821_09400 [Acidobacteria bacterium]|nr:hypothetical protein [Acidobacteriota bacterium]